MPTDVDQSWATNISDFFQTQTFFDFFMRLCDFLSTWQPDVLFFLWYLGCLYLRFYIHTHFDFAAPKKAD